MLDKTDYILKEYIDTAIKKDTLNQSYIFEGAEGTGRRELALYTAKAILCNGEAASNKPCGECHSCKLIDSGNHPDCVALIHEKPNTVSVDDIREQVVNDIDVRPYYGGKKVYIIPDAELMSAGAQNALLKTIEEPPVYALIILIVKNKELLLQTIRSRCVTLTFRAEPEFQADDEAVAMQFDKMAGIVSGRDSSDTAELMGFAKELVSEYKEYLPEIFTYIERLCRDALLAKSGIYLTEKPSSVYIDKTAEIPYEGLEKILKATKQARHDILLNVASEAVMDSLFLHIKQAAGAQK